MKQSALITRGRLFLAAVLLAIVTAQAQAYDRMVVFGDSLSDNGNLALAVGPGVFPALNYDTLRATDGPMTTPASSITGLAVEQLNAALGLTPLTPAVLGGNNYSWGLATTGYTSLDLLSGVTPGTGTQVATYLATHPVVSPDSLFVLWAGSNDLVDGGTPSGIQAAEANAIANLQSQITALLSAGAKNILWFNLPDLSLTPTGQGYSATLRNQLHTSSLQFRSDWEASLQQFQAVFPTANVTGVDTYAFLNAIVANPLAYGFTDVTDPAQGLLGVNPDQYLFWDSLHPTTRADQLLAAFALQQVQPVPEPNGSLFLGFAVVIGAAGRLMVRRRQRKH